jgi:hypothetical protein
VFFQRFAFERTKVAKSGFKDDDTSKALYMQRLKMSDLAKMVQHCLEYKDEMEALGLADSSNLFRVL